MENAAETGHEETKPQNKRGFWGWFVIGIRSLFILLFTVILLGGLYLKAPWKILVLDGLLLALLTVVPKPKRKYGWLTLAAAVLAVTVWIFIPEKDTGDWRPYTFDEELAVLEAERMVPPEADAAPLYEDLFQRWKEIEENDPFPEEADDECETESRPWTAKEFPEVAAWFERHEDFFGDLIAATQKPSCYFPAAVTMWGLSESMERFSPLREFSQHLIRASYLDVGENRSPSVVLEKQLAVLRIGKHINQQPLLIDTLVGIATEARAYESLKATLVKESICKNLTFDDIAVVKKAIELSHFDHQEKWKQLIAYEKLSTKNTFGMLYEINLEGKTRYARGMSLLNVLNQSIDMDNRVEYSYSYGVFTKVSIIMLWLGGFPNDPIEIFHLIEDEWDIRKDTLKEKQAKPPQLHDLIPTGLCNYKKFVDASMDLSFSLLEKEKGIFEEYGFKKEGITLICDLVVYKKQCGQYPNTLDDLWASEEEEQIVSGLCNGFIYEKTGDSFKLYHVGQNGIDENGEYKMPPYDPNDSMAGLFGNRKPKPDDILIWPVELEDEN